MKYTLFVRFPRSELFLLDGWKVFSFLFFFNTHIKCLKRQGTFIMTYLDFGRQVNCTVFGRGKTNTAGSRRKKMKLRENETRNREPRPDRIVRIILIIFFLFSRAWEVTKNCPKIKSQKIIPPRFSAARRNNNILRIRVRNNKTFVYYVKKNEYDACVRVRERQKKKKIEIIR